FSVNLRARDVGGLEIIAHRRIETFIGAAYRNAHLPKKERGGTHAFARNANEMCSLEIHVAIPIDAPGRCESVPPFELHAVAVLILPHHGPRRKRLQSKRNEIFW